MKEKKSPTDENERGKNKDARRKATPVGEGREKKAKRGKQQQAILKSNRSSSRS